MAFARGYSHNGLFTIAHCITILHFSLYFPVYSLPIFGFLDLHAESITDLKRAVCVDTVCNLSSGKKITEEMLNEIVQLPDKSGCERFYSVLNKTLRKLKGDPIFSMLSVELHDGESLDDTFCAIEEDSSDSEV